MFFWSSNKQPRFRHACMPSLPLTNLTFGKGKSALKLKIRRSMGVMTSNKCFTQLLQTIILTCCVHKTDCKELYTINVRLYVVLHEKLVLLYTALL